MSSVVAQLNAALGTNLQFSNSSGSVLQVLNAGGGVTVNSLSETSTVTSLQSGGAALPLFVDGSGSTAITGAITANGSQTTGLAGTIEVNPHSLLRRRISSIIPFHEFRGFDAAELILNQLTNKSLTYSPTTGIGTAQSPYSGTLTNYMSQIVSQQSQAANSATNLQQGQDTVLNSLQTSLNDQSGVNIDTQMSNLITLQNAYAANARAMSTIQSLMMTLLQMVRDEYYWPRIYYCVDPYGAELHVQSAEHIEPAA